MSRPPSIESLRRRIASLQDERDALASQTRSRAEIAAQLDHQLDAWHTAGAAHLAREFGRAAAGQAFDPLALRAGPGGVLNVAPLLVALLGVDGVKGAFLASLDAIPEGVATADRLARIADLTAQLDELETQEERLIMASEGQIERRPAARPEIVLGC